YLKRYGTMEPNQDAAEALQRLLVKCATPLSIRYIPDMASSPSNRAAPVFVSGDGGCGSRGGGGSSGNLGAGGGAPSGGSAAPSSPAISTKRGASSSEPPGGLSPAKAAKTHQVPAPITRALAVAAAG
ncbi:hypothetical protein MNEG_14169, partial [Monoraphidium neglectum]